MSAVSTTKDRFMTTQTIRRALVAVALTLAAALAVAAPAPAAFGIASFTTDVSDHRAGGHPDATTAFTFNTTAGPFGPVPDEMVKDIEVSLPPGLIGNPNAAPRCTPAKVMANSCPAETQVGVTDISYQLLDILPVATVPYAVYNITPPGESAAAFAFNFSQRIVEIRARVRSAGDYGLTTDITDVNRGALLHGVKLTLWGVPADPANDDDRGACLGGAAGDLCPSSAPREPFMRNPTACDTGELTTRLRVASWEAPGAWETATTSTPAPQGCGDVPFAPSIAVATDTAEPDTPTGVTVDVDVPQSDDADAPATADLRRATVQLPEGLTLSPGVADGLQACTDEQFAERSLAASTCPQASRLGSARIETPLTTEPLSGPITLGPSGEGVYRIMLDTAAPGVRLKLRGEVRTDPVTGRLTTTFAANPQLPFNRFRLRFDGGPRAALVTPAACGAGETVATLDAWNGASRTVRHTLAFGGDCARPFAPTFAAGVTEPLAGRPTGLTVQLQRADRTDLLGQIAEVRLPAGLTANVAAVPRCAAAAAAAAACPPASRVGRVTVATGAGSAPFHLAGTAYLTEGYAGAPFGLALTLRAVAGPIDLGTVLVRSAIKVGGDGRISVATDPLPTTLGGIPLRMRSVDLTFDRPGFMLNPTSCEPAAIGATIKSTGGATRELSSRFQVTGCGSLPFAPRISAVASGGGRSKPAGLKVRIEQAAGQASMRRTVVELPRQLAVRLEVMDGVCRADQLAAGACPASARVGTARAVTPILPEPLAGPVLLVEGPGTLPKLVAELNGNGISLRLDGETALIKQGVRTTFPAVPDVPLTSFELDLPHTGNAVLQSAAALPCAGMRLTGSFVAHNGARRAARVAVPAGCPAVVGRKLEGTKLVVRVRAPGAGKLTVRGPGLRTAQRSIRRAGVVTISLRLTRAAARRLRATKTFHTDIRVGYVPTRGSASSSTTEVRLRAASR